MSPRAAISLAFLINGLMSGAIATRLPQFMIQAELNKAEVGLMLFAFAFAAVLGFPAAGVAISRIGSRRVTVFTAGASIAAFCLLSQSYSLASAMLFMGLLGLFHGAMDVGMNQQGVEIEDHRDKKILGSLHALWTLGAMISAGVAYLANRADLSILSHYALLSVLMLGILIWFARHLYASGERPEPQPVLVLPPKSLLGLAIVGFFLTVCEGALFEWSTLWVVEIAGSPVDWAVVGSLIFLGAMVIARFSLDFLIARFSALFLLSTAALGAGSALAFGVAVGTLPAALFGLAIGGLGIAGTFPILVGIAAREKTLAAGMGTAAMTLFLYGGSLSGAPTMGFVAQGYSVRTAMGVVACLLIIVGSYAAIKALTQRRLV